ncbi:1095_t:CDS:2, partial [Funneliformis caledonium]
YWIANNNAGQTTRDNLDFSDDDLENSDKENISDNNDNFK